MPAVKELAGKAADFGTNFLIPAKGMAQGAKLLFGEPETGFDPEAQRQALSQMGNAQKGVERVALGLNAIAETPGASVRYLGETAVQAGRNLMGNLQQEGYRDKLGEAIRLYFKTNNGETAFDPVLLKYVTVPVGTPPSKAHEAYLKLMEDKAQYERAVAELEASTTDPQVDSGSAASRMMGQAQAKRQAAVEGLSPTGQFLGGTAISIGQNASVMLLAAVNPVKLRRFQRMAARHHSLSSMGVTGDF